MKLIVGILLVLALEQDKLRIRIQPLVPTEKAWPVGGTIERPEDTLLQIYALRLERRWDAKIGKFRESPSAESRIWARALVSRKEFQAILPKAPSGFYRLCVCEEASELHAERLLLGRSSDLTASWVGLSERLEQCRGRLAKLLELAEKVSKDETTAGPTVKKEFMSALAKEDRFLEETALKSDFTAAPALLRGVVWHLRNAQIWRSTAVDDEERKFLDPKTTFLSLGSTMAVAQTVISAEWRTSILSVLGELLGRAAERPGKLLPAVRRGGFEALKALESNPEVDKDFTSAVRHAAEVDENTMKDLKAALDALQAALVEKP